MLKLRKSQERGHANHGWLNSYHTFSFASYHDPAHMHFRELRVINDDRVTPGSGFGTHPHQDMEIISYVVEGAIEHKDSMGNVHVLHQGEVQRMSAGTGVTHSEYNHSTEAPLRFLQIWILPDQKGIEPGYEQMKYTDRLRPDEPCLLVSPDGEQGSVRIHQDIKLYTARVTEGGEMPFDIPAGRHAWVQIVNGEVEVNGVHMRAGDGLAVSDEPGLHFKGQQASELLIFDLN